MGLNERITITMIRRPDMSQDPTTTVTFPRLTEKQAEGVVYLLQANKIYYNYKVSKYLIAFAVTVILIVVGLFAGAFDGYPNSITPFWTSLATGLGGYILGAVLYYKSVVKEHNKEIRRALHVLDLIHEKEPSLAMRLREELLIARAFRQRWTKGIPFEDELTSIRLSEMKPIAAIDKDSESEVNQYVSVPRP